MEYREWYFYLFILSGYLAVIKLDTIFLRTSLSTLKLFSSAKPVKRILFGSNSHVIHRMLSTWFMARNAISNTLGPPPRNLKLDLGITNPL